MILSLLFAINIFVIVVYQNFFVYTIPVPESQIFKPDGNSGYYDLDFSDAPFFSDKEILDIMGWIYEQIILYQNADGSVEVVRLKQNILFEKDYALDHCSITPVPDGGTVTLSVRNFLGVDKIVISDRCDIISVNGYGFFRSQKNIMAMIGFYAFLLLVLECFIITIIQKPSKSEKY